MELNDTQKIRYERNYLLKEVGIEGQKKLLSSSVLVIGAGAIGGAALMYLAAAGVGTLGVSDFDAVELTNLQRQIIHTTENVGMSKLVSAQKRIHAINPDIRVVPVAEKMCAHNISDTIASYDFILDCTDRFSSKFLINDACVLASKPYCHAGIVRFGGQVMTYVPDQGPCLRCLLEEVPSPEDAPLAASVGVLGAATGIIGSIQATEAIKYLLGIGKLLTGRLLQIDTLDMHFQEIKIDSRNPACGVCGEHPRIRTLSDNTEEYLI